MHTLSITHGLGLVFFAALALGACEGTVSGARSLDDARDSGALADGPALKAARIELAIDPPRALYRPSQAIRITGRVLDARDQDIVDAKLTWQVSPAEGATPDGTDEYLLLEEGHINFQACLAGTTHCEDASILVDAASPVLELSSPAPGAELGGDGATSIEVHGSIVDTEATGLFVRVNGALAEIDALGAFTAQIKPTWGVNHIDVVGSDGLSAETGIQRDVLWADTYLPWQLDEMRQTPSTAVDNAVELRLGSGIFDDGVPVSNTLPIETHDLADLIELVVQRLELKSALPDPLVNAAPTLSLRVTNVKQSAVEANINLVDYGAELFVRIGSVRVDTEGALDLHGTRLDLSGGIDLALSALAVLHIDKASSDAPVSVKLESLNTAIESAEPHFGSAEANAVFRLAESTLRRSLERTLDDGFKNKLAKALPSVLEGALSTLDASLRNRSLLLDTEFLPPMNLEIDARIQSLETLHGLRLGTALEAAVGSDQPLAHATSRGTPGQPWGAMGGLFDSRPLQLGVRMDLLNAVLHTLWNAGVFELDALPFLPEDLKGLVTRMELSGGLPPVLRRGRASEGSDLWLSIGQLEFALDFETACRYGITIEAGVDVSVMNNALVVQVAEKPALRTWLIENTPGQRALDPEILREVLEDLLWPTLRDTMNKSLSIQLPSLSPTALHNNAPELAGLSLALESASRTDVREGVLILDLALLGRLP